MEKKDISYIPRDGVFSQEPLPQDEEEQTPTEYWYNAGKRVSSIDDCEAAMQVMPSFNKNLRRDQREQ
jgi:hypothetical protein